MNIRHPDWGLRALRLYVAAAFRRAMLRYATPRVLPPMQRLCHDDHWLLLAS